MQILELEVLKGPNFWSIRWPNLIQMKLDLEELEERPTNTIHGFLERLEKRLPSMITHECSEGVRGGFFLRVKDGTWMGHVIEHIALELQTLAGMDCGFGRTRSTGEREGVYYVVFGYREAAAGLYTARAAVRIAEALINGTGYNLEQDIQQLRNIRAAARLPPAIESIVTEAAKRNIPYLRLNKDAGVQLGYGIYQKRIRPDIASTTSSLGVETAGDKEKTKALHETAENWPLNKAEPVVDRLFPEDSNGRIPLIAITGTNGQTTTALTAHIAQTAGKKAGHATSDGIFIQGQQRLWGDGTGFAPSRLVLKDPAVDFAVLECAPHGILNEGLGFQQCNVAIVTNVATDHPGDPKAAEQMAKVKRVVPETVHKDGYAVLNADDDLVYGMKDHLDCQIALFSMHPGHPRIREHCNKGGKACVYENGYITFLKGNQRIRVLPVKDIPLTQGGKVLHYLASVLSAILSTWVFKEISIEDIRQALLTFNPAVPVQPARFHFSGLNRCHFLAVHAHALNEFQFLGNLINQLDYAYNLMIISTITDNQDDDIVALGAITGHHFDEIMIQHNRNVKGRTEVEILNVLQQGIQEVDRTKEIRVLSDEPKAIHQAYTHAPDGSLIVVVGDEVLETMNTIKKLKEDEEKGIKKKK